MSNDDVKYFEKRAIEERERAAAATDPCARKAHEKIAEEYERLARGAEEPALRVLAE
jgi:hypothetical protein